jgi:hypothetical protein
MKDNNNKSQSQQQQQQQQQQTTTNLPEVRCLMRKRIPNKKQRQPTMIYAYPRKGFLPPIQELSDKITNFLPEKLATGKSYIKSITMTS